MFVFDPKDFSSEKNRMFLFLDVLEFSSISSMMMNLASILNYFSAEIISSALDG